MSRHLLLALTLFFVACNKADEAAPEAPEPTSGGEAPAEAPYEPERPADAASRVPADEERARDAEEPKPTPPPVVADEPEEESPWGQTKSEQCRPPERPAFSSGAAGAIADGVHAMRAGRDEEAKSHFTRAISLDARAYVAHHNLGVIADRAGRESEALEHYRRARQIAPDYTPSIRGASTIEWRRGSIYDALALVAPLAQQYKTNLDLQALHAEVLVRAGRYDEAWAVGRRALECDERHVPTLKAIIRASLAQGRHDLAESVLTQALAIRETDPELHFMQGTLLSKKPGRVREALEELRRAVALRPDYAEARMALGTLELSAGNYAEAVAHFEAVDRVVPNSVEAKLNLADAYRASRRWADAQRTFERVLQMDPNLPEAYFNLGLMYQTPGFELPGFDELAALQRAKQYFSNYRGLKGAKLDRNDPSGEYLTTINRRIQRIEEARRREAEEARRREEAERRGGQAAPEEEDDVIFFD